MEELVKLLSTYDPVLVIMVLLIGIPAIIHFIGWCKQVWAKREAFKQTHIQKGMAIESEIEAKEKRSQEEEARIAKLEERQSEMLEIINRQQELISLLIRSDELDIKCWIKQQHEKWIPRGCIDSQSLDLLEHRYEVYEEEGGNSWAKKLMDELRALPTVTVIPLSNDFRE